MRVLYIFLILYIILFLTDYLILKKLKKYGTNDYTYLLYKYSLKKNKIPKNYKIISSLLNALIMSLVATFAITINLSILIVIPVSFILIILLIYIIYGLYGKYLRRSGYGKNTKKKSDKIN